MKINHLDAHDRLKHLKKQDFLIGDCCQDLINKRPFGDHNFYIYAHPRTDDDGVTKRLIWQPRLTKPTMETNSMLFKAYIKSGDLKVIWILPAVELWGQHDKGKLIEDKIVTESIYNYRNHKKKMEAKEPDDLEDWQIDDIYREMKINKPKLIF